MYSVLLLIVFLADASGEKPYHCDDCGMKFSHSGSLGRHLLTNTGEKAQGGSDQLPVITRSYNKTTLLHTFHRHQTPPQ